MNKVTKVLLTGLGQGAVSFLLMNTLLWSYVNSEKIIFYITSFALPMFLIASSGIIYSRIFNDMNIGARNEQV